MYTVTAPPVMHTVQIPNDSDDELLITHLSLLIIIVLPKPRHANGMLVSFNSSHNEVTS